MHEADLFTDGLPGFFIPFAPKLFKLDTPRGKNMRRRLSDDLTQRIYRKPMFDIASSYNGNIWIYEYDYEKHCRHAEEVAVLFGSKTEPDRQSSIPSDSKLEPDAEALGVKMRSVWGRFASFGNPGWGMYKDSREIYIFK